MKPGDLAQQVAQSIPQPIHTGGNWTAVIAAFGSFLGWLPNIAAGFSIAWLAFQFWVAWKRRVWEKEKDK